MSISSAGLFSQLLGQNKNLTFTPDTRTLFISSVKVKASICFHNIVMSQGIWGLIFLGFKMSSLCYFYPIRQCHGYKNELLSDDHRPLTFDHSNVISSSVSPSGCLCQMDLVFTRMERHEVTATVTFDLSKTSSAPFILETQWGGLYDPLCPLWLVSGSTMSSHNVIFYKLKCFNLFKINIVSQGITSSVCCSQDWRQ